VPLQYRALGRVQVERDRSGTGQDLPRVPVLTAKAETLKAES